MTLGQLVDYCVTWNKVNDAESEPKEVKRKATQADWNALLG